MGEENEKEGGNRRLDQTPTWAVAGVCASIILFSFFLEKALQRVGKWLTRKHKKALYEALDKVKGELMVLGFISLLLTFSQGYISKICIPSTAADFMLPCPMRGGDNDNEEHHRRLLWNEHRRLVSGESVYKCRPGKEPLITVEAAHQLHILIFFLAVFHVLYSAVTMMLGRLKIRRWKEWERETLSLDYEYTNDPSRIRLTHDTSFVKAHSSFWTRLPFFFYVGCFYRQFFRSVTKADYLTLRNGFIAAHIAPGSRFNFRKYIKRSLEDDFKVVVGVSPVLWASFVLFLLLNVNGWHTLFWASIVPLIIILAVGTKLQVILTMMALEITERHSVIQGIPLVQGSDGYFWFSNPQFILHLLHFTLFQYEFGIHSCFHDKSLFVLIKIGIGVIALVLCSYSTLPLYALVTQMGSQMKKTIFDEQTSKALKKWHMDVKRKREESNTDPKSPPPTLGGSSDGSKHNSLRRYSSGPTSLHRYMTTGHSTLSSAYDDGTIYEVDDDHSPLANLIVRVDDDDNEVAKMMTLPPREELNKEDDRHHVMSNST